MHRVWVDTALLSAVVTCSIVAEAEEGPTGVPENENRYTIEVITMDPGRELFSRWGHICIMVVDQQNRSRRVYNFGTFDFSDPSLMFQYAKGYLDFWVSVIPYKTMVAYYRSQKRGMVTRTLSLSDADAAVLAERLEVYLLPENRTYAYRHYIDNCCTRIRDLLSDVLGGATQRQFETGTTDRTYRHYTRRALTGLPFMRSVILFVLGREIDRPITRFGEQFLPEVFGEDLDGITINGRPLVSERTVIYAPEGPRVGEAPAAWEYILLTGILMSLVLGLGLPLLFRNRKWASRIAGFGLVSWGMLSGLGGLLILFLWTATAHYDCHKNENILVFPILHLLMIGPGLKLLFKGTLSERMVRLLQMYLAVALAVLGISLLLKLGPFFQQNYLFIFFAAVMNAASLVIVRNVSGNHKAPQVDTVR